MKIMNPDNIAQHEKEFIDTINAKLDWEAIEKMLLEKHRFTLQKKMDCKGGDLIVHNDNIAYKFNFEIKVPLSVIVDRQGECLEISTLKDNFEYNEDDNQDNLMSDDDPVFAKKFNSEDKTGKMASNIADMISEINQGDE